MLNLVNKVVTVILTLIVMINNCNGFITDKNVLLDEGKFTPKRVTTCAEFEEQSSQYSINNTQFIYYKPDTYLSLLYANDGINEDTYVPFRLYNRNKLLGMYKDCKDAVLYFGSEQKEFTLELRRMLLLKPKDTFVKPPELIDADTIGKVTTCKEFDDKVIQKNTSGFFIYKDKLGNLYSRVCIWKGCAVNFYYYSELPESESWTDLFRRPDPFGFYWMEKKDIANDPKLVYQDCNNDKLNFIEHYKGGPDSHVTQRLSNLTFYNIKPKTRSLKDLKLHFSVSLLTCNQFYEYLKNHKNTSDGYIYFFDPRNPDTIVDQYFAMKVYLYGPEDSRERPYLLSYKQIDSTHKGFFPVKRIELFVRCINPTALTVFRNDSLMFESDSNYSTVYSELKDLLFYDGNKAYSTLKLAKVSTDLPFNDGNEDSSEEASGFEMKVLHDHS